MEQSTAAQTEKYITEHPYIQSCLRKGLINYSALARLISQELNITKSSSQEAILVAARRYQQKLQEKNQREAKIQTLLKDSEIEIKNKMAVYILDKSTNVDKLHDTIRQQRGTIYFIEGSSAYTVITQERFAKEFKQVIEATTDVALLMFTSPESIENTPGVIAYLTSLFAENGVNLLEVLSCWTDTFFVINSKDAPKAMRLLEF